MLNAVPAALFGAVERSIGVRQQRFQVGEIDLSTQAGVGNRNPEADGKWRQ